MSVRELQVIEEPEQAIAALEPMRARILTELGRPGTATSVAAAIGATRQKVNYHLRQLEACGLVRFVEERPRRGLLERVMVASARSYVLSPQVLRDNAARPERVDRLSASYLVALAARLVREVGHLLNAADAAGKSLPTLAIDTEIRFASARERAAFTEELAQAITGLAARYHDERAPHGRRHRLVVGAHPMPASSPPTAKGT